MTRAQIVSLAHRQYAKDCAFSRMAERKVADVELDKRQVRLIGEDGDVIAAFAYLVAPNGEATITRLWASAS